MTLRPAIVRASVLSGASMARNKGNPRCEACEGRGIVPTESGYTVCRCIKGEPNRALLARLAALPLPDFAADDDKWRAERGLPPFKYTGGVHSDT